MAPMSKTMINIKDRIRFANLLGRLRHANSTTTLFSEIDIPSEMSTSALNLSTAYSDKPLDLLLDEYFSYQPKKRQVIRLKIVRRQRLAPILDSDLQVDPFEN